MNQLNNNLMTAGDIEDNQSESSCNSIHESDAEFGMFSGSESNTYMIDKDTADIICDYLKIENDGYNKITLKYDSDDHVEYDEICECGCGVEKIIVKECYVTLLGCKFKQVNNGDTVSMKIYMDLIDIITRVEPSDDYVFVYNELQMSNLDILPKTITKPSQTYDYIEWNI